MEWIEHIDAAPVFEPEYAATRWVLGPPSTFGSNSIRVQKFWVPSLTEFLGIAFSPRLPQQGRNLPTATITLEHKSHIRTNTLARVFAAQDTLKRPPDPRVDAVDLDPGAQRASSYTSPGRAVDKINQDRSSQDDLSVPSSIINEALTHILGARTNANEEIYPNPIFLPRKIAGISGNQVLRSKPCAAEA
ncbi:hypothetical protein B0H13DRAFT_1889477 [Mycena leptocephala]|nr:hypothetical protein B0H13DRAFT_1889477 [Mycena leptocephala]